MVPSRHDFGNLTGNNVCFDPDMPELQPGDRCISRMWSCRRTVPLDMLPDNEHYRELYPPEHNSYDTEFMHGKPEYSELYKLLTRKELPGVDGPTTFSAPEGASHGSAQIASSPARPRAPALGQTSGGTKEASPCITSAERSAKSGTDWQSHQAQQAARRAQEQAASSMSDTNPPSTAHTPSPSASATSLDHPSAGTGNSSTGSSAVRRGGVYSNITPAPGGINIFGDMGKSAWGRVPPGPVLYGDVVRTDSNSGQDTDS